MSIDLRRREFIATHARQLTPSGPIPARTFMLCRRPIGGIVAAATLLVNFAFAQPLDESKYLDLNGEWSRGDEPAQWDPTKPRGLQQQAPLTAEYQSIFEANLATLHSGDG